MAARWGEGKVQVLALRPEIQSRLASGFTISRIHADLTAAGKITISLWPFRRHVAALCQAGQGKSGPVGTSSPSSSLPVSKPVSAPAVPGGIPERREWKSASNKNTLAIWDGEDPDPSNEQGEAG